jgi:hypothetical protein
MTTPAKDTEMSSNNPEKAGAVAAADAAAAPKVDAKPAMTSQTRSQSDCDGPYICDCSLWYVFSAPSFASGVR